MNLYAKGDLLIDPADDSEYIIERIIPMLGGVGIYAIDVYDLTRNCEWWWFPMSLVRTMLHVPGGDLGGKVP